MALGSIKARSGSRETSGRHPNSHEFGYMYISDGGTDLVIDSLDVEEDEDDQD